jgi:phosphoribosylglycinamide formyltransferase-1
MFTSGGASTACAIIRACKSGRLPGVVPTLFITNKPEAGGVEKAVREGMQDIVVLQRKSYETQEAFGEALLKACRSRGVDAIGQFGWLPLTPANVIEAYEGRILNQHPGPLRSNGIDFGGEGMFGKRVHCAVLLFNRWQHRPKPWTEVVTHRVTPEFDRGAVVRMRRVEIFPTDDVLTLQERALLEEHQTQIEALDDLANNRLTEAVLEPLLDFKERNILVRAKETARILFPKG